MSIIDRLWPEPALALDDAALAENYTFPDEPWLRANFIASADGAVTREGRSGGLGDEADHRVFDLLRRDADVVIVGAGTARTEGYGAMRLPDELVRWRLEQGLPAHPVFVLVTRTLDLDPASEVFTLAPVRPIIYTISGVAADDGTGVAAAAPAAVAERRDRFDRLSKVADVVEAGESDVDPHLMRQDLAARGYRRLHTEGGPHFLGALIAAGAVDELCLTIAPTLEGGAAGRIATASETTPLGMSLRAVLRSGDELFLRYVRAGGAFRPAS